MALGNSISSSRAGASGTSRRARRSMPPAPTKRPPVRRCGSRRLQSTCGARSSSSSPVLLGEAPPDGDLQPRAALLHGLQLAEVPVELVVGVLADAAGVEHDDIGLFEVVGARHSLAREHRGDAFGVVLVHLAPEGANQEPAGLGHAEEVTAAGRSACLACAGRRPAPRRGDSHAGQLFLVHVALAAPPRRQRPRRGRPRPRSRRRVAGRSRTEPR